MLLLLPWRCWWRERSSLLPCLLLRWQRHCRLLWPGLQRWGCRVQLPRLLLLRKLLRWPWHLRLYLLVLPL